MEEDFHVDSGADGSVDCEEYRFAVFQMADKWTNSVDAKEYREFLKKGYDVILFFSRCFYYGKVSFVLPITHRPSYDQS